jgi:hypothetical protein
MIGQTKETQAHVNYRQETSINAASSRPGVQLRDWKVWLPDSLITFTSRGVRRDKTVYDIAAYEQRRYEWINNAWSLYDSWFYYGLSFYYEVQLTYIDGLPSFAFPIAAGWMGWFDFEWDSRFRSTHDEKGNLTSVVITKDNDSTSINIAYNKNNQPVSIDYFDTDSLLWRADYQYNSDGETVLFDCHSFDFKTNKWIIFSELPKMTCTFDAKGRPVSVTQLVAEARTNRWIIEFIGTYYYPTKSTGIESVESSTASVSLSDGVIHIQSDRAEQITIYSINGAKLYERSIQAGANAIDASAFPKGVLLVTSNNGWVKKIVK